MLIALVGGFALGAYLAWQIGYQGNLPQNFLVWIQAHGHLQLVGWVRLFIMGVSLFFIPRLAGVPLARRRWQWWILPLTAGGLIAQTGGRLLYGGVEEGLARGRLRATVAVGGLVEWLGLMAYIAALAPVAFRRPHGKITGLDKLRPFFVMMTIGWILYATLWVWFTVQMAGTGDMVAPRNWNQWAVEVELALVLFPVAYAFSVRNLPYFLYLPPVTAPVERWGYAYLGATVLVLGGLHPWALAASPRTALMVAALGRVARDGIILWLVWDLNVFVRTRPLPYILAERSELNPNPPPKPWRRWFDHARWGRPEWLIVTAYAWLVFGTTVDLLHASDALVGGHFALSQDALRHTFLLGFITLLICGMAQKMVPGFLHKPRLAYPPLAIWILVFGNAGVLCRVVPLLLPLGRLPPRAVNIAMPALAWSGLLAWITIALTGWNLWRTACLHRSGDVPVS